MAQDMTSKYTTPVVRNCCFSIYKSDSTGEATMSTSSKPATKSTGAAAKAQRQAKLTVVQTSEPEVQVSEQASETATCPRCDAVVDANALGETGMCVQCEEETLAERTELPVADLLTARRTLDKQIKAAKAAQPAKQPKPEKPAKTLADVIEKQLARPRTDAPRIITTYVLQRQAAGQDIYEAVDQVLGQMRSIVLGALDRKQPGESYHQAIYRYLGRTDMLAQADSAGTDDTSDEQ